MWRQADVLSLFDGRHGSGFARCGCGNVAVRRALLAAAQI